MRHIHTKRSKICIHGCIIGNYNQLANYALRISFALETPSLGMTQPPCTQPLCSLQVHTILISNCFIVLRHFSPNHTRCHYTTRNAQQTTVGTNVAWMRATASTTPHATLRDKKRTNAVSTARPVVLRLRSSPDSTWSRRVVCGPAAYTPLLLHYLFRRVMILTAKQAARNILPPISTTNEVAVPTYGELTNLIWLSILGALYTLS